MSETLAASPRRGRPPKFGRPAQLVTLTLPNDVVTWLKSLHDDPAWAIVKLHERATRRATKAGPLAELVPLPNRRALIMVTVDGLRKLPGAAVIPLSDGRGILALEAGRGIADLELIVIDRLEDRDIPKVERDALQTLRDRLREWRQQGVQFESRAIIVATRGGVPPAGPPTAARRPRQTSRHAG